MSSSLRLLSIIALTLILAAPSYAADAVQIAEDSSWKSVEPYRIGPGDLLHVNIWKNDDFTGNYLVRPDGKITLPLIGDIIAAGMATDTISLQIERKLMNFIETPYVTVIVVETNSHKFFVLGEVTLPGAYAIQGDLTVIQAIALAGGFTEFANEDKMLLIRREDGGQKKYQVSYRDILKGIEEGSNLFLKSNDTLVVP